MSIEVLGVIPARWQSKRFPGKPLVKLAGREMVARVWDRVKQAKSIDRVVVATDDDRIFRFCQSNGIEVVITSEEHPTGSDRIAEVATQIPAEIYVNVQGDEPLIEPKAINSVTECLKNNIDRGIEVATGYIEDVTSDQLDDPSVVHLVPSVNGTVITFSRLPIPYPMGEPMQRTVHVGLYAFTRSGLYNYIGLKRGPVERAESIEILRFIENGYQVACVKVPPGSRGVDTPEDVKLVEAVLSKAKMQ